MEIEIVEIVEKYKKKHGKKTYKIVDNETIIIQFNCTANKFKRKIHWIRRP